MSIPAGAASNNFDINNVGKSKQNQGFSPKGAEDFGDVFNLIQKQLGETDTKVTSIPTKEDTTIGKNGQSEINSLVDVLGDLFDKEIRGVDGFKGDQKSDRSLWDGV